MKNWEKMKLGEVCGFVRGPFGGSLKKNIFKSIGYAVYEQQHAIYDQFEDVRYFIDEKKFNEMKRFELYPGDLIMSCSGTMGKIAIVPENVKKGIINQALLKLSPSKRVSNIFLKLWMQSQSFQDSLKEYSQGAAIQNVASVAILKNIEIPLPPLSEQQRIIAILDEAFAGIAKAKANAEQNINNAKELFESYLQSVFENKGEGWEEKTLGEIADVEYGYTDKSTEGGDYRYIRITDIDKNGELILEEKKYIKHSKEAEGFLIEENDLLMARTGATFAKVLLFNGNEPSVFASYLIRIKFKGRIENELYWHFTKTKSYWEQANRLQSGAAQPHFNGAAVKQVIFSYPKAAKEQKLLIEKFRALSAETKKLEIIYKQKTNDLEELKKSILQKAFSGSLNYDLYDSCDSHDGVGKKVSKSL